MRNPEKAGGGALAPKTSHKTMLTFGYHPDAQDLESALGRFTFARAVVVDDEVSRLFDEVAHVRVSTTDPAGLPSGVYWFAGLAQPIVMQVPVGVPGASAESEMAELEGETDNPLVEALRWAEHLWETGMEVPNPKFDIGARAVTVPDGMDVEIRSRSFYATRWSYQVRGPSGIQSVLESKLAPVEFTDDPEDWVQGEISSAERLGATLTRTKLKGRFADTIYSFQATRTVFRPYQFKPVLKLLQSGQARLLIADEVGLGKTIEAGLIWTELEARHDADRVLIVCPSVLVEKWRDEMQERFGFDLIVLNRDELNKLLEQHESGRLPKRKAYVVSLETLRTWPGLDDLSENPPEFDLVIVDEAHAMRNSDTKSYKLGTQLYEWTIGSNMIFLTATPVNLRETDLLNLLGLLEPADFEKLEDLEARLEPTAVLNEVGKRLTAGDSSPQEFDEILSSLRGMVFEKAITLRGEFGELKEILSRAPLVPRDIAQARRHISKLNGLATTVTRTRRAEVDEKKAQRNAAGIPITWNPEESEFYQQYLVWCAARAKAAKTAMYFSMQMPIRLASTSVHLAARSVLRSDPEYWVGDAGDSLPKNWIDPHPELVGAARRVLESADTKLERLGGVLEELHTLKRPALLFTWSKATLKYLEESYRDKYRIAVLSGDVRRDRRRIIMREFREGKYDFLFANKVASEGLDFEFCSAVINYDLPWNPMEVEQRIGRIDRIGQQSEKILIRNFYNDEAIDSRIMYRVLERIEIFERSIGELEPIIGQHMDLLSSAMDFTLTEEEQEARTQQFLTAIEAERSMLRDVADSAAGLMIANDVEIAGLEEELTSTGRYLGQKELAHLLDDWAQNDGADRLTWLDDKGVVELRGNPTMAGRLVDLTQSGRRTGAETGALRSQLQNNEPIYLALDHELARMTETELLSATHPLVMAAVEVPGHRHARFASIRVPATDHVPSGAYTVVLAHAEHASQGGDEIWGAAVDDTGARVDGAADAVLAALARGVLSQGSLPDTSSLPRLVSRAKRDLERQHREAQDRRDAEETILVETRRAILADQHERRMKGIQRRMQTIVERERGSSVLRMVEGQSTRQRARYEQLIAELENKKPPAVALRYLAVCALEVGP